MAVEQELTPEEKLLQVIQKGEPRTATSIPAGDVPVDVPLMDSLSTVSAKTSTRGLVLLNRALAAVAVVFLMLAGGETYRNFPTQAVAYPSEELDLSAGDAGRVDPPSLNDTLKIFDEKRIFGAAPKQEGPGPAITNITSFVGWRAYARENFSLMGMSDVKHVEDGVEKIQREAIVMDNKAKKMYFLTEGKVLSVAEQEVTVARVDDSLVELRVGEESLKIE